MRTFVYITRGHSRGQIGSVAGVFHERVEKWRDAKFTTTQKVLVKIPGAAFPRDFARLPVTALREATDFELIAAGMK